MTVIEDLYNGFMSTKTSNATENVNNSATKTSREMEDEF